MRSPAAHSPHYRSHSPLSPKTRGNVACKSASHDDVEVNPAKDLEQLVRQVRFDLKHFCDVISKRKLEMLSGNGTIVLDTITNIHTAIRPYLASPCPALQTALTTVCTALAGLIRLCDEALLAEDAGTCDALQAANVTAVVGAVQAAVEELATLALERMGGRPALAPRSAVVTPRAHASPTTPHAQRNSLPDIPLTPKERALLACGSGGAGGAGSVRATHSTESILDSVATEQPPPKPPRPERKIDIAPPLPPKKKIHDGSLLGLSAIDRVSLQSHSSGSLDSMLNASNDDEIRAIMEQSAANLDDSNLHHPTSDILAICSCVSSEGYSNRVSLDSSSTTHTNHSGVSAAEQTAGNTVVASMHNHDAHNTLVASSTATQHTTNHNRFSNESGFVSMGHAARCSEISYASSSFNCSRTLGFTEMNCAMDSVLGVTETTTSSSTSVRQCNTTNTVVRGNGLMEINKEGYQLDMKSATHMFKQNSITHVHNSNGNSIDVKHSDMSSMSLNTTEGSLTVPPALPAKTRRSTRSRPDSSDTASGEFPGVEIRQHWNSCAVHGEMMQRPHTLADNAPPPLPLKKKHMFQSVAYSVMAYMEMFGNCSHPPNAAVAATEMFRHSIHTYNLAGNHQQSQALHQQHLQTQHVQQLEQKSIAQSVTLHHFNAQQTNCSIENNSMSCMSPNMPIVSLPPTPPALPPKKNKLKQSPSRSPAPPSPRLGAPELQVSDAPTPPHESAYHLNNSEEDSNTCKVGKFPVCELDTLCTSSASGSPSPGGFTHSADDSTAAHDSFSEGGGRGEEQDIITELDVSAWLVLKASDEEGPDVRGGHPDALIVHATKASKDFAYQEAFLTTYRTFVAPSALVSRLARRAAALAARQRRARARETHALLARVVSDLTTQDLDGALLQEIMEFVYSLVQSGDLAMAKALRVIILDKYKQLQTMSDTSWPANLTASAGLSSRRETLLDFKASELAEQMTLLDAALFTRIAPAEVLAWTRHQAEDTSPNLTQFTEHFNKMSYWARSRILEQEEARDREKYMLKFIKVMKHLRKINNFNSYLALLSALDSGPIRRLEWPRSATDALDEYCALIDSSSSFRAYRQALAETQPPCIPYIGLVLQDLTFIHIGNSDLLPDGSINFSKRWQQYHIVENMKRFNKAQYTFRKSERVMAMFNGFDEVLSEEAMWQISQQIKPRGGRTKPAPAAGQTAA